MLSLIVLGLFCVGLILCMATGADLLWALLFGLLLFGFYGIRSGFSLKDVARMCLRGMLSVWKLLLVFLLIGILTALWRQCGTIAEIICLCSGLFSPRVFLPLTFLLNCLLSFLIGTSFGTAATMGTITVTLGRAMGLPLPLLGGAMLSGIFFGDRCSPLSTSALLTSECTKTDRYGNIKNMFRSGLIPFCLALICFAAAGCLIETGEAETDLYALFSRGFSLKLSLLLPAVLILVLSLLRVDVKLSMAAGIVSAAAVSLLVQKCAPASLLSAAVGGFHAADADIAKLLDGGGLVSMVRTEAIVCLSCAYAGIFEKTDLLKAPETLLRKLAERCGIFFSTLCASFLTAGVSCNQTLSILLTNQLCAPFTGNRDLLALNLEDSAVLTASLLPWSIACSVPLATVGAPSSSILFACYLYLVPLTRLLLPKASLPKALREQAKKEIG